MSRLSGALIASIATAATAAALLWACAAPRRSFDGKVFRDGAVAFQIGEVPSGWRSVDVSDAALAYRDEAHSASVLVNARCLRPDEGTPLVALTNHLIIGSTAREVVSQEAEPFDGREALHTRLRAKWDGVPIAFDIFVMKKDGCVYDFVYMGDPTAFDAGSRDFQAFVRGFRTLPGSGIIGRGSKG
jgi:hypothetical protein